MTQCKKAPSKIGHRSRPLLLESYYRPESLGHQMVSIRYDQLVKVAFDEQIFAVQRYGGISRLFAELAEQFNQDASLDVELAPLAAPIINHYLLDDPQLATALQVTQARSYHNAMFHYFVHGRRKADIDVVHSTFYLPRGLADYPNVPKVMTVHDMIPELLPRTRRRLDFITMKKRYVMQADHIICVSESTRRDLELIYGDLDVPISVVHHGVDDVFRPGAPPIPEFPSEYLIFVGNRGDYKDARTLLKALALIAGDFPDLQLVFVGGGPLTTSESRYLGELGLSDRVQQVSLNEDQMASAYSNARMCVFPSRYEGFGLPALEAMACGTPLVLADSSSLPEVGGNAAVYFAPGDEKSLAQEIAGLIHNEEARSRLSALGLERAQLFTWRSAAQKTKNVYSQAIADFTRK